MYLPGRIHSSRPNWVIIHMKRSDTCSRFPAIRYQICSYLLIELNAGQGFIANQIISFMFALTIYDEFDDNAMVTDRTITTRSFQEL